MTAQSTYTACVDALRDFVQEAGFSDVVLGLSGGMDSALVACMAVDALGADRVHAAMLPGPYSSQASIDDAQELADNLGIEAQAISILRPFEGFEAALARPCGGSLSGLAAENVQARCRMVCLMALSNAHGWMLLNTGNKSEGLMGYATLYGDMAGAFAPIGDVYKTDVYRLASWRNEKAERAGERPPIPRSVFTKPPSAELSADQTDEKSMGASYEVIDAALRAFESGADVPAVAKACGRSEDFVREIERRVAASAFKRALAPQAPSVEGLRK